MIIPGTSFTTVPGDFFGLHINKVASSQPINTQTPWVELRQGWHRIWDNYTTWKLINTANGVYDWSRLDNVVSIAKDQHGKKLIIGIGCAPDWATGASTGGGQYSPHVPTDASWIAWVTALVTRYAGRIDAYELWNEPTDGLFWNGTTAQLVNLCALAYPIIKSIDPTATVLSPCYPSILSVPAFSKFLGAGGGDYCDGLAYHGYVREYQPEYLIYCTESYQGVAHRWGVSKPFWDTEWGWLKYVNEAGTLVTGNTSGDVMTDQQGCSYVARHMLVSATLGLRMSIYYTADGQADSSYLMKPTMLDYATRTIKQPAALTFQFLAGLLQGACIGNVQTDGLKFWLSGQRGGRRFTAYWTRDFKTSELALAGLGVTSAKDCRGGDVSIAGSGLTITMEPTILYF